MGDAGPSSDSGISGFSSPTSENGDIKKSPIQYFPKDEPYNPARPVKVIIVGAGIAGIATSILISRKVPNVTYTLYEKNYTVGGTWAENVYPGVRCDVPSHVYQLTFAPNLDWSEYYPKGAEIREYYERVVEEYGVAPNLKLKHEVLHAQWLSETSQWQIRVKDLETGEEKTETADFFVSAQGRLNSWKWPDVPGLHYFKGTLCHTSKYDTSFDHIGKKVAIIGNGASGVQILPNILPETAHIDHYIRSKGWVAPAFRGNLFEVKADQPGGPKYTEEERKLWKKYPELYLEYRRSLEKHFHGGFKGGILGTPENEAFRKQCIQTTRDRLDGDEELLAKILPDYTPGCKRPTPAPGYIESLRDPKVELITNKIIAVTETGIVTEDGKHREVDAIIAATGHWNGFLPRFPTIGENGVDLSKLWAAGGPLGYPDTYFGVMAPDFPNYFFVLQAQGNGAGGSVPLQAESSATYIARAIRKVQSQSYTALVPKHEATIEFNHLLDGYFDNKVLSDTCDSWLKAGKGKTRVLAGWPGSGHHRFDILREPRWEDFDYVRSKDARSNRYEYFGNGWTEKERRGDANENTKYLFEVGKADLATLHEAWNLGLDINS